MEKQQLTLVSPAEAVQGFLQALNKEDFDTARQYLADDFTFVGVLGTRNGADVYMQDMKKMKFKYVVKKLFVQDQDVSVFYDINMGEVVIFAAGWYQAGKDGIKSLNVIFDPRPVLAKS